MLRVKLLTPEAHLFDDKAESVVIPAYDGEVGVMKGHAPMVARLGYGSMKIRRNDEETVFFVGGGFVEVFSNGVTVIAESAMPAGDVEFDKAEVMLKEARDMLWADEEEYTRKMREEARARAMMRMAEKEKAK